ncbi:hypothetical protein [Bifidobacterium breve]|uniref:hypothetical protein n=1 Tax=Bifidobacterium breve TaxID=1685 RepID=UPI00080BB7E9|nr:hypothetical protein [Bifidobacterium breve]
MDCRLASLTQLAIPTFKTQNNGSFEMKFDPQIIINHGLGLLFLKFPPVKVNVTNQSFPWMDCKSGPKPSTVIELGYAYQHAIGNFTYKCRWNSNGSISIITGYTAGDLLQPLPLVVSIPDGVTFG